VESLKEAMTRMPHLQLVWNGYDVAICRSNDMLSVWVKVVMKRQEMVFYVINYDSSLKPYASYLMEGESPHKDAFYGDPKNLPENLQSCEKDLIDFILEQDWEKQLDDFDGWTKERKKS